MDNQGSKERFGRGGDSAVLVLALLWWAPSFLLVLARWQGGRVRFEAVLVLGRALVALGWPEVASRVYAAEIRRAEHGIRAIRAAQREGAS